MIRVPLLSLALIASAAAGPSARFRFTAAEPARPSAIAVDSHGNTFLTGSVVGNPFVATPGAYQSQNAAGNYCVRGTGFGPPIFNQPCDNAFVIKLDTTGSVVFATYLGGGGDARATAIAVDANDDVYIAGQGGGVGGFPVTEGAAFASGSSFLVKLRADGSSLAYSTLIPGAVISAINIDSSGNLLFAGNGFAQFPATAGAYQSKYPVIPNAYADNRAIAGELNAAGSALAFATFLSGDHGPSGSAGIALDASGNVLVGGYNYGPAGAYGDTSVFLSKLSPDGSNLISNTSFGSAFVQSMKVAPTGDIYIACGGASPGFPVIGDGFGVAAPSKPGFNWLLHVAPDATTLLGSIYVPFAFSPIDVDAAGNVYLAGTIEGDFLSATNGAFQAHFGGGQTDAIVAKLTADGSVAGVTYAGGSGDDFAFLMAALPDGSVVVTGTTSNGEFLGSSGSGDFLANLFPALTIENAASYVANAVAPGELVSIQGYGLGGRVLFDEFSAPILYESTTQINVQVPWEVAGRQKIAVTVSNAGASVPVRDAQPGIFYIVNSDGSRNSAENPAHGGDFVSIYATGGGATTIPGVTGMPWPAAPLTTLAQRVSVALSAGTGSVIYAGSAPTLGSGMFQMNVQIDAAVDLPLSRTITVTVGGATSASAPIWIVR